MEVVVFIVKHPLLLIKSIYVSHVGLLTVSSGGREYCI